MLNNKKTSATSIVFFTITMVLLVIAIGLTISLLPFLVDTFTNNGVNAPDSNPEIALGVGVILGLSYLLVAVVLALSYGVTVILSIVTAVKIYRSQESKVMFIISVVVGVLCAIAFIVLDFAL